MKNSNSHRGTIVWNLLEPSAVWRSMAAIAVLHIFFSHFSTKKSFYNPKRVWKYWLNLNGQDPYSKFSNDICGALIHKDHYGCGGEYGWEVDHITPLNEGGNNSYLNLRPLHHENKESRNDQPDIDSDYWYLNRG